MCLVLWYIELATMDKVMENDFLGMSTMTDIFRICKSNQRQGVWMMVGSKHIDGQPYTFVP